MEGVMLVIVHLLTIVRFLLRLFCTTMAMTMPDSSSYAKLLSLATVGI